MAEWRFPAFGHGGDYNPDQWLHVPGIFEADLQLMRQAHVNLVSVGIFSWTALEPAEGQYETAWLEKVLDGLHGVGVSVLL
ncbi:MAG: beta-galactosidase, partial [Clostridia bacterium]